MNHTINDSSIGPWKNTPYHMSILVWAARKKAKEAFPLDLASRPPIPPLTERTHSVWASTSINPLIGLLNYPVINLCFWQSASKFVF